ncbi:MAG TPA: ABC transporter substrate-binding protein [Candidatus Paceibacterota bacterium]|nr:ABC transporter substrate-binding protein [Candidatus Paceibacterota bacterium]
MFPASRQSERGAAGPALMIVLVALAAVALWAAVSRQASDPQSEAERPVRLGAILPLSGDAAEMGRASERGLMLAKEDVARELERYAPLRIFVGDSAFDPEQGSTTAVALLSDEFGVDVLFSSFSYVTAAVNGISADAGIPLFYDSCNCGFAEENPFAFQVYFDPRKECRSIAEYFERQGVTRGAFIGQDVPYGRYCYEAAEAVLGEGNVLIELESAGAQKDYEALARSLRAEGVGFVISVPAMNDFKAFLEANQRSGANLALACHEGVCLTEELVAEVDPAALENVIAFGFRVSPAFEARMRFAHPAMSRQEMMSAAIAYDVARYSAEASRGCPAGDSRCIVARLEEISLDDPAIESTGFGEDHILDYASVYTVFAEGALAPLTLE